MKALKLLIATGLALAFAGATAEPGDPGTGIKGTRHDWSAPVAPDGLSGGLSLLQWCPSTGCTATVLPTIYKGPGYIASIDPATGKQTSVRVQFGLCTKCHTPHQARSTNLLWNHTLLATNYSWDQPRTTAGTNYPTFVGDSYKGPSTKCLSCHDGTMASTDGVWFLRQRLPTPKLLFLRNNDSGHDVAHETGSLAGSHPVAFPYPLNGAPNSYNGAMTGSEIVFAEFAADPTADGIRLFNDAAGNVTAGKVPGATGMECTSCHDVHNGARVQDQQLLTGSIDGNQADGYICTKCHKK